MVLLTACIARRRNYPKDAAFSGRSLWVAFRHAFWALMMPVLILVGFRMGVFTATEIAGVAAAYSLIVGLFFYRTLHWSAAADDPADHGQGNGGDPADRRRGRAVQLDPRHRAGAAADHRGAQERHRPARGWCCCC